MNLDSGMRADISFRQRRAATPIFGLPVLPRGISISGLPRSLAQRYDRHQGANPISRFLDFLCYRYCFAYVVRCN